jgi:hypothetical protein
MKAPGAAPVGGTTGHGNQSGNANIIGPRAGARKPVRPSVARIGDSRGRLDYSALLSESQQQEVVRKLARAGMAPAAIATASGIAARTVGQILAASESA